MEEFAKQVEETQKRRREEKQRQAERLSKEKEALAKLNVMKAIEEKLDESVNEDLSEDSRGNVQGLDKAVPLNKSDLREINQFDFSKLIDTKKPANVKKEDLIGIRTIPRLDRKE
jgi:hypothetical protein